jgi:hypothetical protein
MVLPTVLPTVPRLVALILASALLLSGAAKKTSATARGENEDLILNVTVYIDSAAVNEALGADLGGHYIVAQVKVEPKYTKEITIDRDDFVLRTDKDGDHTTPMAPSQIAGRGGLVLTRTYGPGGEGAERSRGWSIGGMGMGGGGAGAGRGPVNTGVKPSEEKSDKEKESPLKTLLDAKVLPEKKIEEPTTGFLFFPMENQKMKDLELVYGGKENRIRMRFK